MVNLNHEEGEGQVHEMEIENHNQEEIVEEDSIQHGVRGGTHWVDGR